MPDKAGERRRRGLREREAGARSRPADEPRGDGTVRWFLTGLVSGVALGLWLAIIVHNVLVID